MGQTFSCIIGLQFSALKDGDRFFFTHHSNGEQSEKGLPRKTKSAVRKRRLSDIICDNTGAESTSALVMKQNQDIQSCTVRPSLGYDDIIPMLPRGKL